MHGKTVCNINDNCKYPYSIQNGVIAKAKVAMIRKSSATCFSLTLMVMCLASCKPSYVPSAPKGSQPVLELRASCAALKRFAEDLQIQPPRNDFQRFAASPDSYTFVVRESRDAYTFYFGLKPFHGRPVIDEGTAYKVDKADMKVAEVAPR
jgi:hypothetical protein